tara:strand:+ start:1488 stop:1889 length:402 start_codon:yes stop_codon:yes gene_type:complete
MGMGEAPPAWGTLLFTIAILLYIWAVLHNARTNPDYEDKRRAARAGNWDLFEIGYIMEPQDNNVVQSPIANSKPKKKKRPKKTRSPIYEDCVDALCYLGYKKTNASKIAQKVFNRTNVKTIEEFIIEANRRDV